MEETSAWIDKKILIVDDSVRIQVELAEIYESIGMTVVGVASDGLEGLELYKSLSPDIVSLDIIMPEMHGIDCFRKLMESDPSLKYIFVSCLAIEAANSEMLQDVIPKNQFVPKPVSREAVEKALAFVFGEMSPLALDSSSPAARSTEVS